MGSLTRTLLGISTDEVSFERRGFRGGAGGMRQRIEDVGRTFLEGYHLALEENRSGPLAARLDTLPRELRGFGYEGAAMGLALAGTLMPWRWRRFDEFLAGPGDAHLYMALIGAGWVMARLPWATRRVFRRLDAHIAPWLAYDGYGFHEGFFHWPTSVEERKRPGSLDAYALRVFDQGLGRSLWFVEGGDVERIPRTVATFATERQADLWSGVGLAATYAGGVSAEALDYLARQAGVEAPFGPQLAQGAAFAAKARERAGNPTAHTETACRIFCGTDAATAAAITDQVLEDLPPDPPGRRGPEAADRQPAFEIWRQRIQSRFAARYELAIAQQGA